MTHDLLERPTGQEIEERTLFDVVPITQVFVDAAYGRSLDETNLRRIIREWDKRALGVILLSLRADGRYAVIDGQHRVEAARKMGVTEIPARVYIDLSSTDEARLYRLFGIHKAQTPLDRFKAALAERNPAALKIKSIIDGIGLDITTGWVGDGKITAIGAVTGIYGRYGPEMLDLVLRTLYAAFGRTHLAYTSAMLKGMSAFIVRFEHCCDWMRLVRRLQEEGLTEINQRALSGRHAFGVGNLATDLTLARIIHDIYNKRASTNALPAFEDRVNPGTQRKTIIGADVRLGQRKALANVPKIWADQHQ